MNTVLFSGRFDPPHPGHFKTIGDLGGKFDMVIVVVLDYKEQLYPVVYRQTVLSDILDMMKGNYMIIPNTAHFGEITKDELALFEFDVYAGGNLDVLRHIEGLGYDVQYTPRAYDYAAADSRLGKKLSEWMK